ncbi:SPOR domain-containing protein [Eikenella sp. S3360]|uniref:SPOR domain-containing protein n=1 Tax=Eikenella glucosivorans TaxID=2766967 RepID=A0ABS0NCF8_9NEIS|nr:SPOR domain-containing protein [Eikenella glucosivorans]MBH5330008.1 SPOR domain-containing protein [Eikenella glucosivorans]
MPPQSNPNWRHLEEYEQIKRKNRRRLVGALLLTAVVALLLAKVLGSDKNNAAPDAVTVSGGETAASAVVESQPLPEPAAEVPDGADTAAEVSAEPVSAPQEVVVAEPVQPAPPPVQPAKPVDTQTAVLPNPLANSGSAANPPAQLRRPAQEQRVESKHAPERRPSAETRPEPRTQQAEVKPTVPTAKPTVPQTAQPAKPEAANTRRTEAEKPQQAAAQASRHRQAEGKPAGQKPAERPQRREEQHRPEQRNNRLSPEEILNNRAANQVSSGGKAADSQAAQPEKRMVIQVGAYTSEEQARAVQKRLADAGVSAYVAAPPNKGGNALYRVRTGSYPNRQAAGQALGKIKAQGLDGMLLER